MPQRRKIARSAAQKKYNKFTIIDLGKELKRLRALEKKQTTEVNSIKIDVIKKLISKKDDKEISATEARVELKKKVAPKKKATKAEFEKARKDIKDKKVSSPKAAGEVIIKYNDSKNSGTFTSIDKATAAIQKKFRSNDFSKLRIYGNMERALADGREVGFKVTFMLRAEKSKREEAGKDKPSDDYVTVTPYYTNDSGAITDTKKTIAK